VKKSSNAVMRFPHSMQTTSKPALTLKNARPDFVKPHFDVGVSMIAFRLTAAHKPRHRHY
jgi:hypothetical protein